MGVRGLQTFMEYNCPNAAYLVKIKDIVETYRRETGRTAVIVVDGSSCLRSLYGKSDWICGGQIKEFVEAFQNFIQAFTELGVKLVFFFDGPTQARKRDVWIERRINSLADVYKAFDHIKEGKCPSDFNRTNIILPPATTYLAHYAISTSQSCEIHRSIRECDEEIAEYGIQHHCFAILGQDSDYIIYDGPQYYLSAVHLDVEKMTTINYNRWALARQLQLSPPLLPLFASLVGNDIIRSDDLVNFHWRICRNRNHRGRNKPGARPNPRDVMYGVASFIRNCTDEYHLFDSLPMISRRVFGNEQRASQLLTSVRSYSINVHPYHQNDDKYSSKLLGERKNWNQIQKLAEKRFKDGDLDSMIYAVMHDLPYESSTGLEDFRETSLPPSASVYLPLRQRIYGIVLYEMPEGPNAKMVGEWCMQGEGSLNEAVHVPVICPSSGFHPGLMVLWDEKVHDSMLNKKWHLLAISVSTKLDPNQLRSLPTPLLTPTLLLFYLINEVPSKFLETWEVDAFIVTAVMLPSYSTKDLRELRIDRAVPRAVQLACIYCRGASIIKMLVDACGRPVPQIEVSLWHCFDGKLFQTMYQKFQLGTKALNLCNSEVTAFEQFNQIRSIVLPSNK